MAFEALQARLEANGFLVRVFATKEEAADYLDGAIDHTTVGFGGSETLRQLGLKDRLAAHNTVYTHHGLTRDEDVDRMIALAMTTDVYVMSANAIAENTGEILNIDCTGNRLSSALFGHRKVYMVAGKNKISPDFDSALYRLRNVVAPKNAQRLHRNTPCAAKGDRCYNCNSPERICNGLLVFYKKMEALAGEEREMEVVLVNEDLGF